MADQIMSIAMYAQWYAEASNNPFCKDYLTMFQAFAMGQASTYNQHNYSSRSLATLKVLKPFWP